MNQTKPTVTITTDGGCQTVAPKIGAWAAILRFNQHVRTISGVEAETTNNRMELTAIIEAFRANRLHVFNSRDKCQSFGQRPVKVESQQNPKSRLGSSPLERYGFARN